MIQFLSREAHTAPLPWCRAGLQGPGTAGILQAELTESSNATRARIKFTVIAQGPEEVAGSMQLKDVIPQIFMTYPGIQPSPKYFFPQVLKYRVAPGALG